MMNNISKRFIRGMNSIKNKIVENKKSIFILWAFISLIIYLIVYLVWKSDQIEGKRGLSDYYRENEWIAWVLGGVFTFITAFIGSLVGEKNFKLYKSQKERIKILHRFSPEKSVLHLFGEESIYNAIIDMLGRAIEAKGVNLRILLCAPAFDYPGRPDLDLGSKQRNEKGWGGPFIDKIAKLVSEGNNNIAFYYLPDQVFSGFNPLRGFIETLANHCAEEMNIPAEQVFELLYKCNKNIEQYLKNSLVSQNVIVNDSIIINIPFQIVLYWTKNKKEHEVVVSFAGKEIIEDERSGQPKGLMSTDCEVVKTFVDVFNNYVTTHRRTPIKPRHTLNVIKMHEGIKTPITINEYMKQETGINGINIKIDKGVFSPSIANSSKFTSYAIDKILNKDLNGVLDIGSGTGVQAILSYKILSERYKIEKPKVVAIEYCDDAYTNLLANCKALSLNIICKKWELLASYGDKDTAGNPLYIQCVNLKEEREVRDGMIGFNEESNSHSRFIEAPMNELGNFKVVIADLPYVDTEPNPDKPLERAFFDTHHVSHRILFKAINRDNCTWADENTLIITSFSTLGGYEDLASFERMISNEKMRVIQSFNFSENGYLWIVYVLKKCENEINDNNYWWNRFNLDDGKRLEEGGVN